MITLKDIKCPKCGSQVLFGETMFGYSCFVMYKCSKCEHEVIGSTEEETKKEFLKNDK